MSENSKITVYFLDKNPYNPYNFRVTNKKIRTFWPPWICHFNLILISLYHLLAIPSIPLTLSSSFLWGK